MTVHFQPDPSQAGLGLHLFPEIRSAHGLFLIIRNSLSPIRFDVLRFLYMPSTACENRLDIRRLCIFDSVLMSLKNALHTDFQIAENDFLKISWQLNYHWYFATYRIISFP